VVVKEEVIGPANEDHCLHYQFNHKLMRFDRPDRSDRLDYERLLERLDGKKLQTNRLISIVGLVISDVLGKIS
jgi:hypothetical protein